MSVTHSPRLDSVLIKTARERPNRNTSNPRLNAVPYACHCSAIEDRPQGAPNAKRSSANDGKRDVISGADTSSHADESTRN